MLFCMKPGAQCTIRHKVASMCDMVRETLLYRKPSNRSHTAVGAMPRLHFEESEIAKSLGQVALPPLPYRTVMMLNVPSAKKSESLSFKFKVTVLASAPLFLCMAFPQQPYHAVGLIGPSSPSPALSWAPPLMSHCLCCPS
jgi:hypothetical protein